MKRLRPFIASTALLLPAVLFAQNLPPPVPLPQDMTIMAPKASLPPGVKAFSGKWVGAWDASGRDHVLVVEEILDADRAIVVYAWGAKADAANPGRPGFMRLRGVIKANQLKLTLNDGASATYVLTPSGELKAKWEQREEALQATLKKVSG